MSLCVLLCQLSQDSCLFNSFWEITSIPNSMTIQQTVVKSLILEDRQMGMWGLHVRHPVFFIKKRLNSDLYTHIKVTSYLFVIFVGLRRKCTVVIVLVLFSHVSDTFNAFLQLLFLCGPFRNHGYRYLLVNSVSLTVLDFMVIAGIKSD